MLEFHYRIVWRAQGGHPGHHAGARAGGGIEFQGSVPFASQPDPRQLDVRAMIADPHQQLMVKSFRQRAAVPVYLIADLSASMGFRGMASKTRLLAEFAESLAWSAWRTGDPFGFLACGSEILWDLSLPLRWHKGMASQLRTSIENFKPQDSEASGLMEAAGQLGRQRALVFLASDFHMPNGELEALFDSLIRHDLVPVVIWDSGEYEHLPQWGLAELLDPESSERRRLFLRPGLLRKLKERFEERRCELINLCARHGREPFFLIDRFDADAMTYYFHQS